MEGIGMTMCFLGTAVAYKLRIHTQWLFNTGNQMRTHSKTLYKPSHYICISTKIATLHFAIRNLFGIFFLFPCVFIVYTHNCTIWNWNQSSCAGYYWLSLGIISLLAVPVWLWSCWDYHFSHSFMLTFL